MRFNLTVWLGFIFELFRKEVKMGERIKGLSIGLDLDAANLNRSFAEIKRNFKTLNSDLKLTGNNFKYTENQLIVTNKGLKNLMELSQVIRKTLMI